jgi:hypothetical protein|tara:strand:- start:781 stop:909 length:129 start_codon:yes stop_codon:yes gene_type:complete
MGSNRRAAMRPSSQTAAEQADVAVSKPRIRIVFRIPVGPDGI